MPLHFTKMHGLGNDYVYVDVFEEHVDDPAELARRISDRQRGVGSDGLILVAPADDAHAHVRMIMFNADGSRAQMCGNGIRCLAKLAYERGIARVNPLRVQTDRGVLSLDLTLDADGCISNVRVDMGAPILEPRLIPVDLPGERVVAYSLSCAGAELRMTCVSMGNPHAVFFQADLNQVPLDEWGPALERHALFPERVNVHFAQVVARNCVRMVSWERGTGATQACGTGAAAVCVAGVLNGVTDRVTTVELRGGQLELEWDQVTNHVFLTGPATEVFTGQWPE